MLSWERSVGKPRICGKVVSMEFGFRLDFLIYDLVWYFVYLYESVIALVIVSFVTMDSSNWEKRDMMFSYNYYYFFFLVSLMILLIQILLLQLK